MKESDYNLLKSYHAFVFPFYFDEDKNKTYDDLLKFLAASWEKSPFCPDESCDEIPNYNEYNYFNSQTRNILYEKCKKSNCNKECNLREGEVRQSLYYTKKLVKNSKYYFHINFENNTYDLEIDEISLRIFKHGIGVLSFHLKNNTYIKLSNILKINQFGRRLYEPYKGNCSQIAESLTITTQNTPQIILASTNYGHHNNKNDLIPKFIKEVFLNNFENNSSTAISEENNVVINSLKSFNDDRMFVISFYKNNLFANSFRYNIQPERDNWYSYLFIDEGSPSCSSEKMKKDLLERHTYSRWLNDGTLYGISKYSFVCLTTNEAPPHIFNHVKTMYYQMIVLTFAQKISIWKFKNKIGHILDIKDDEKKLEEIESLHKKYLEFINKVCLDEVTQQEQGIEMYDMMRSIMGIKASSKEIKKEISELFDFSNYVESDKINKKINTLTVIGATLGLSSLLASIMSLTANSWLSIFNITLFFILTLALSFILYVLMYGNNIKKAKKELKFRKYTYTLLVSLIMVLLTIFFVATSGEKPILPVVEEIHEFFNKINNSL